MSVLPKIREKLNKAIKVALAEVDADPSNDFFRGRLSGLLVVRDGILYNMKED